MVDTFDELLAAFKARSPAEIDGVPLLRFAVPPQWEVGGPFGDGCGPREVEFWQAVCKASCFELEMVMAASVLERLLAQNKYLEPSGRFRAWPSRDRHQLWAALWLALRLVPGRSYSGAEVERFMGGHLTSEAASASLVVAMTADLERRGLLVRDEAGGCTPSRSRIGFVLDGDKLFAVRAAVASDRPWWALPIAAQHVACPPPEPRPPSTRFRVVLLDAAPEAPSSPLQALACAAGAQLVARFAAAGDAQLVRSDRSSVLQGGRAFVALEAEFDKPTRCCEVVVAAAERDGAPPRVPPFLVECLVGEGAGAEWAALAAQPMPTSEEMCNSGRISARCFLPAAVAVAPLPAGAEALFAALLESGSAGGAGGRGGEGPGRIKRWPSKLKQQQQVCLYLALRMLPETVYAEAEIDWLVGAHWSRSTVPDIPTVRKEFERHGLLERQAGGGGFRLQPGATRDALEAMAGAQRGETAKLDPPTTPGAEANPAPPTEAVGETKAVAGKGVAGKEVASCGRCGVLDGVEVEYVAVADPPTGSAPRRAIFAIKKFVLIGCELTSAPAGSTAELEVVRTDLLNAPIDPEVLQAAGTVSEALAAVAVNASNVACARLNAVWKEQGRADAACAVLPVT